MKVCFVTGTLGRGGAERQLVFMLKALRNANVGTRVLCMTNGEAYQDEIREMDIDVRWVGSSSNRCLRLYEVIKGVREYAPSIVQSSHFFTNIYAAAAGRILGVANIGAIRSNLTRELAANGFYGAWQLRLPRHLIANSQISVDRAISLGVPRNRIDHVPNVVDGPNVLTSPDRCQNGAVSVLFAGRLVPVKRPEHFIALASRLRRDLPDVRLSFRIAGDGPLLGNLQRMAQEHGLHDETLTFLGERPDMSEIYRSADILVLSSEFEGVPNVVLEAMAHGVPVVATQVGGVPEVLNNKRGILVEPTNFEELVAATKKLILNPDLRRTFGEEGRNFTAHDRSLESLQARLFSIYEKLLGDSMHDKQ